VATGAGSGGSSLFLLQLKKVVMIRVKINGIVRQYGVIRVFIGRYFGLKVEKKSIEIKILN